MNAGGSGVGLADCGREPGIGLSDCERSREPGVLSDCERGKEPGIGIARL